MDHCESLKFGSVDPDPRAWNLRQGGPLHESRDSFDSWGEGLGGFGVAWDEGHLMPLWLFSDSGLDVKKVYALVLCCAQTPFMLSQLHFWEDDSRTIRITT